MLRYVLGLDLLNSGDDIVGTKTLNVDGHRKKHELRKMVYVFVRLTGLHPGEQRHQQWLKVWSQMITVRRVSIENPAGGFEDDIRWDVSHDRLEELKAPRIVNF